MRWKLLSIVLLAFLVLPTSAGAVDFSITDVQINAQLQPDGTVQVKEQHTYDFDSEFNGIIREIKPKKGALIEQFTAYEKDKALKVEKKNYEYRAYRKGDSEVITVDLQYNIVHGMEKYEDGAQFYWPFFDQRNETDYENMTITVVPPSAASDVLFLGYDSAEETGKVKADGSVVFAMGTVYSGENGDIRVIYEPSLFPGMNARDGEIRPVVKEEQQRLAMARAQFLADQQRAGTIGGVSVAAGFIAVVVIGMFANGRRKRHRKEAQYEIDSNGFYVPQSDMSMPALLLFRKGTATIELMSAALLDLVRKGHVKQLSDEEFELADTNVKLEHEKQLIQLLFYQIGKDKKFTLEQLKSYTKAKKNYESFNLKFTMWQKLLKEELDQYELHEKTTTERVVLSVIGLMGIGIVVYLLVYELYLLMFVAILLTLVALAFALFYRAHNYVGILLSQEWSQVEKWMKELDTKKWESLSIDDRFRVLIYGVGVKHPELDSYYNAFAHAQQQLDENRTNPNQRHSSNYEESYYGGMVYNPVFLAGSFSQASTNVAANTPSSDSYGSSSSGGTGGGGGGSGAF
ncbi:DUF2207 domain-containing protein [Sporosarcina sp. GW1-11]|uniref:DUF2207 domain-containing protein n=1 Tax=Sporosarcina sp. GW1-11 TaxID=2899126 RepID=UPI00294DD0A7|nr:DUF2207 domain-containing protein [Sporosarcina sp. GW1-11]MDV6379090.1 DUF2207 domain-containing protein [Sporosarcina sp. GW1-11]